MNSFPLKDHFLRKSFRWAAMAGFLLMGCKQPVFHIAAVSYDRTSDEIVVPLKNEVSSQNRILGGTYWFPNENAPLQVWNNGNLPKSVLFACGLGRVLDGIRDSDPTAIKSQYQDWVKEVRNEPETSIYSTFSNSTVSAGVNVPFVSGLVQAGGSVEEREVSIALKLDVKSNSVQFTERTRNCILNVLAGSYPNVYVLTEVSFGGRIELESEGTVLNVSPSVGLSRGPSLTFQYADGQAFSKYRMKGLNMKGVEGRFEEGKGPFFKGVTTMMEEAVRANRAVDDKALTSLASEYVRSTTGQVPVSAKLERLSWSTCDRAWANRKGESYNPIPVTIADRDFNLDPYVQNSVMEANGVVTVEPHLLVEEVEGSGNLYARADIMLASSPSVDQLAQNFNSDAMEVSAELKLCLEDREIADDRVRRENAACGQPYTWHSYPKSAQRSIPLETRAFPIAEPGDSGRTYAAILEVGKCSVKSNNASISNTDGCEVYVQSGKLKVVFDSDPIPFPLSERLTDRCGR